MNYKLKLGLILFALGMIGVLSLLTISIPMDQLPEEVLKTVSPEILKYLILINPAIFLLIAVITGTLLFDKVGLSIPAISSLLKSEPAPITFTAQLKAGITLGLIAGVLTSLIGLAYKPYMPQELIEAGEKIQTTVIAKFAYGGITEELMMRYGFMTLIVWVVYKLSRNLNGVTYWSGIIVSGLIFAIGHFPVVFTAIENPSTILLSYILIGNTVAGLFFGWLYWKKGLEAAIIGHIFAHVAMIAFEKIN